MRRDTKAVTRRQRYFTDEIGVSESPFEDYPAIMHNRNDAPRLLGLEHLVFEPSPDVLERGVQPLCHVFDHPDEGRHHASRPRGGRLIVAVSWAARCSASCMSNIARAAALRFSLSSSRWSVHQS